MNISSLSLASVYGQLTSFAKLENFWSFFETAFGSNYDFATAASLRSQWQESNFSLFPQIEVVSSEVLGSANGAYAISTNKIYLSDQFVSRASQQSLDAVILEEFGHFVDAQVNATDTAGDEGELFSALVRGVNLSAAELSRIKTEDDHAVIVVDGQSIVIEQNQFYTYSYLGKQLTIISSDSNSEEKVFVKVVFQTSQPLAANSLYTSKESANFQNGSISLVDSSGQIVRDFNLPLLHFQVHTSNQGTIDAWHFQGDDGVTQNDHSIYTYSIQNFLLPDFNVNVNYPAGYEQGDIVDWSTNTGIWSGGRSYTSAPLTSWTTSPSAPSDLFLSTRTINENQAIDTTVGTFTTRDLDTGNTFTYSLVTGTGDTDNALFTITDNQLKTNATFDYETRNRYSIRVKTTDQSGLSYQKAFTINVSNDVDEQNQLYTYSYLGNQSLSTTENVFVKVVFKSFQPLAANTIYRSIFAARDNTAPTDTYFPYGSLSLVNSFGQIFRGINFTPILLIHTSNQGTIDAWYAMVEGRTVDEYREAFGLVGFNVSTYFDPNSVLPLNHASYLPIGSDFADVENWSPDGSINTWDGSSKYWQEYTSYTSAPSWTISPPQSPPNNSPIDLFLSTSTINENQASGTTVGTFTTADPDTGNTFTYSLVTGTGDTDNTVFRIVGNQLKSNDIFDFETQNSYSIRVQTTDEGGLTFEKVLTIGITDINETPINLSVSNNTIAENQAIGTAIGTFTTTDPDTDDTFTYNLVTGTGSTDNVLFTITGNQLKSNGIFDFETQNSYSIRVRTTDQGGLTFEKALTLNVKDIAGILSINNISVTEGNTGSTNATFTVSLSDPYAGTVSVDYATVNGTAYSTPYDYTAKSGTLNFSGGVTSQTVNVAVLGDTYNEANENFSLNLSNPTNAQLANTTGTATIIDDDPLPTFSISSLQLAEGDSGSKNAQLMCSYPLLVVKSSLSTTPPSMERLIQVATTPPPVEPSSLHQVIP